MSFAAYLPIFLIAASPFIGSFLGALAFRLPEKEEFVFGRSHCRSCGKTLGPVDLLPIVSWLILRGRCRACGERIPLVHPLIEIGAVVVAVAAVFASAGPLLVVTCLLGWALLLAAAIDLRVFILPNAITLPLIPVGLAANYLLSPERSVWDFVIGAAAGAGLFFVIGLLYEKLRHRRGLGMGDIKLMAAAGAWLGWQPLSWLVLLATVFALALVLALRIGGKAITGTTALPYGAPLAAAFFVLWIARLSGGAS